MKPAWIHLECPSCQEVWESALDAVPPLDDDFSCPYCQTRNSTSAFVKTREGLEIVESFQGEGGTRRRAEE